MRKTLALTGAALFLGLTGPAVAQHGGSAADQSAQSNSASAADPDRRICVREAITGSRMARTVCRTAREWQREEGGIPESR